MRKLGLALFALVLVAFTSCGKGITPVTEKIDGPLGDYFEVVSKPYQANEEGMVALELKRIKDGLPAPWQQGMAMGTDDNTFEPVFKAEFIDKEGKVFSTDETDISFNRSELTDLFKKPVGEIGSLAFGVNAKVAKQVKIGSEFTVRQPTKINLSGSIGKNLPICMSLLISTHGNVKGAYYYKKMGPNALLYLKGDLDGDDLPLMEYNKKGNHTGEYDGTFTGNRYRGEFEAYTGSTYDFDLREDKDMEFIDFSDVDFDEFYETEFYVREVPAGLGGSNWDEILDRYEALADDYIRLYKKSLSGNITAATEMVSVLSDYESLSEEIEKARGTMTTAQANRFANIQRRMLNAIQ